MKIMGKLSGFILLLSLLSCSENSREVARKMASEAPDAQKAEQETEEIGDRKLIKEGHVAFETDDLVFTRKIIIKAVNKHGAYVSSDMEYTSSGRKSNSLTIRVPADNFNKLLNDATEGVDRFESKEIHVKDVTEEFVDISARLKTKKELENRFLGLLKQANTVSEILEIEKQIAELRSDIESVEGRLKYLESRVSLATLNITFYENLPEESEFGNKLENGFRNGWENLIWFFVLIINIWPFIIVTLGLIIGIRLYKRRK